VSNCRKETTCTVGGKLVDPKWTRIENRRSPACRYRSRTATA
jgi:hypothetical protein